MTKTKPVGIRLTPEQIARLDRICQVTRRSRSAVVGLAIEAATPDDLALPGLADDNGRVICAWCKREMGPYAGEGVSHGICPTCLATECAKVESEDA